MDPKQRNYVYGDKSYPAEITYRRGGKNIVVRYLDGVVKVSSPMGVPIYRVDKAVMELLPKLLKNQRKVEKPYHDGEVYLLGKKIYVGELTEEDLTAYLKEKAYPLYEERLRHYEGLMGIDPPYRLRVRSMKSRYGVNSRRTHTITLQLELIHYSLPILDAVVVHELAHHYVFDHSSAFYEVVYRYCPDYDILHEKLRKGQYE